MNTSQPRTRKTGNLFWPTMESSPLSTTAATTHAHDFSSLNKPAAAQDTSAAETAEIDELSEPYYVNDTDSLSEFFAEDPYPIQGGLEKLELIDGGGSSDTVETTGMDEEEEDDLHRTASNTDPLYNHIEALMYGMNQQKINHRAALDLACQNPSDPVMIAVQALLHRDDATVNTLWTRANQLGISSKVDQDCGFVQAVVGKMLEDGVGGVVKDIRGAEFWYTRAARNGNATAQFFLGQFHVKACQYDKARHWLERAAKQGNARAQMHFGLLFEHGRVGVRGRRDYERAKEWYQRATDQGDAKAACRLGFLVRKKNQQGLGVSLLAKRETIQRTAMSKAEPSVFGEHRASDSPPPVAMDDSGKSSEFELKDKMLNMGPKVLAPSEANDDVLAVRSLWLEEQGSAKKRRLESSINSSDRADVSHSIDPQVGVESLPHTELHFKSTEFPMAMEGSSKIHRSPEDSKSKLYVRVESLLYGMNTIKVDQQVALQLAQQHPSDPVMLCVQAMLQRDESAADVLWTRANELGISSLVELGGGLVQALVGKMLENGLGGVTENMRRAEFWYNQAAKKGHATAQFFLGLFHLKDGAYERARFWLEQAAKQGHARAQMHFGLWFEHNHDFETAKFWYKRSVSQGDSKAKYRLDFVEGKMKQRLLASRQLKDPPATSVQVLFKSMGTERTNMESMLSFVPSADTRQDSTTPNAESLQVNEKSGFVQNAALLASSPPNVPMTAKLSASTSVFDMTMQIGSTYHASAQESRMDGNVPVPVAYEAPLEPDLVKPYCAVMGDKSTRGARLTTGTKILREVKEWYKENRTFFQESNRDSALFEEAMKRYFTKMATLFPDFPEGRHEREQTLLVKCTKKSIESDRVEKANCFRYPGEKHCQYGTAKLPHAVLFFFDSRDPPKLDAEVSRYRRKLGARSDIQGEGREYFLSYLDFCAATANRAAEGCPTAQLALESTNFIPALKKLWDDLERGST